MAPNAVTPTARASSTEREKREMVMKTVPE